MRRGGLVLLVGVAALLVVFPLARADDERVKADDLAQMAERLLSGSHADFQDTVGRLKQMTEPQLQAFMGHVRRLARTPGSHDAPDSQDRPIVTIDARVLEVPRGTFDPQPTAQNPVRYLTALQAEAVMRAAKKSERIEVLASPRITAYSGQDAHISAVNQTSFVQDYDVEKTKDGAIADPIIGILQEGLVLELRPVVSVDGKTITVEMDGTWSKLARPIPEMEIEVLGDHRVKVQLPEIATHRLKASATMPSGATALIGGGPLVNRDGTAFARMVMLHVQRTKLDSLPEIERK